MPAESTPDTFHASAEEAGSRFDHFLAIRRTDLSRSRIQDLIRSGHARRNGEVAKPGDTLRPGDTLTIEVPAAVPVERLLGECLPLEILHEDPDLIVINKPPGLVVHPGAGNPDGTLVNALLHHCGGLSVIGGEERPGIVHRLDKDTSGCIVIAKNDAAHHRLAAQFADRTIEKVYLAVVFGLPRRRSGTVDAAISRHRVHRQRMAVSNHENARPAVTDWRLLGYEGDLALVECRPHTGRTHQIRVHLKHLGLPLAGDPVYGRRGKFDRHLLHAWSLAFDHPATSERMTFVAPVPQDFPLVPPDAPGQP